jgi:hypothetical protein
LAVSEVIRFVEANAPDFWHEESLFSLLRTAYHSALRRIKERAAKDDYPLKDYDTTLTSTIYNGVNAVFGHVGDGGIIALSPFGDFSILTTAQKGEEFNQVTPLRSGPENWLFGASSESVAALLMLTDGVYDVVCPWLIAKRDQKIYVNYVRPFIDRNILTVKTAADFENAQKEIVEFFSSEQSRQITDDKTILGIINTDVLPETKPAEYYEEPDWKRLADEHREKLYEHKTNLDSKTTTDARAVPSEEKHEASPTTDSGEQKNGDDAKQVILSSMTKKDLKSTKNNSIMSRLFKRKG